MDGNTMKARVKDIFKEDLGTGIARIDPEMISEERIDAGDTICIYNDTTQKFTPAIAFPSDYRDKGTKFIRIDAFSRRNLNASIDDVVRIQKTKDYLATEVIFAGYQKKYILNNSKILAQKLKNRLVSKGDIFSFRSGNKRVDLIVVDHIPQTRVVKIHKKTRVLMQK